MLVGVPSIVVGMVTVLPMLPEVTVVVRIPFVGVNTTATLVGVPLIVVGMVVVNPLLPEVTVVV